MQSGPQQRFEILGPLGQGGYGAVYEALDTTTGQHVAIKELHRPTASGLARFKHEFRALTNLHHPHLVDLRELYEKDDRWFIVMELVPGTDLLSYARRECRRTGDNDNAPPMVDLPRLAGALLGVTHGLLALHHFGIVHRDLKPSNVCVTSRGRAVLLDFGLVTSADPTRQSSAHAGVGTAAYMAPEQALGGVIGPPADWYALGTCLFEAMTGKLPFEAGSALQVMLAKQSAPAPRISHTVPSVPAALDALCASLLEHDPARRPAGRIVLQTLTRLTQGLPRQPLSEPAPTFAQVAFTGRDVEVDHLMRALESTRSGGLRVMLIEGESGVGKTELVEHFLRTARERHPELCTLTGRCYENEHVSYKAFDGAVDQLAVLLNRLSSQDRDRLLPPRAALLGQIFPVLKSVKQIAEARAMSTSAEPTARRLEAFRDLCELWMRLAHERPLILAVEDLQWADSESFRLLEILVEHAQVPAPLVVATIRPREELDPHLLDKTNRLRGWQRTQIIPLQGLPRPQAITLAHQLLGPGASDAQARAIADESQGHPMFTQELASFALNPSRRTDSQLTLDAALGARMDTLGPRERELLELLTIAGRPYSSYLFATALDLSNVDALLRPLLNAKLARRRGSEVSVFHDRIRHVAMARMAPHRIAEVHSAWASALALDPGSDAAEQARHWDRGGEPTRAIRAYDEASSRALASLAFVQAEALTGRALSLLENDLSPARDSLRTELLERRARALSGTGRNAEAAEAFSQAAALGEGDQRIRLRGLAANHLLFSGRLVPGLYAARAVLNELGIALPLTPIRAWLRVLWERLRPAPSLRLRRQLNEAKRRHHRLSLDAIKGLKRSIALVHPPAYVALIMQQHRLAFTLGTVSDLVDAHAARGWLEIVQGSMAAGAASLAQSRRLGEELGTPDVIASQAISEGSALLMALDIEGAERCLQRAHDALQAHCPERVNDLTLVRSHLGTTWFQMGKHARIAHELDSWLSEVRERKDPLAECLLVGSGHGYLRHLMRDDPAAAMVELTATRAAIPDRPFSFAHLGHVNAMQLSQTYQSGPDGLRWRDERQRDLDRHLFLRVGFGRQVALWNRVSVLLAAANDATEDERRVLWRRVRKDLARMLRGRSRGMPTAFAQLARSQMAACDGRMAEAWKHLARARRPDVGPVPWIAEVSGYLEGLLLGREQGAALRERTLAHYRGEGWLRPDRAVRLGLPLAPLLQRKLLDD